MGKKYKRELVTHLLFDYEGIEEHLEKMAARGWYLETPGNTIWKYRGAEPAEVKYAVTYVPKASQFDPEPNEEQRTLEEFCSTAGWEKVGDFLQAQIYMNRQPNPVAIETEDEVRLEVIRKAMRKSFVPAHVALILLMLFNTWIGSLAFFNHPVEQMSGYGSLLSTLFLPIGTMLISANLIAYYVWLHNSAKSIASGGTCASPKLVRLLNRWELPVVLLYFAGMVVGMSDEGDISEARYMVLYMIGFFGLISLLNASKNFMKRRGVSRGTNIAVFVVVDIVGAIAMVSLVSWLAFSGAIFDREPEDPYASQVHETFLVKEISGQLESPGIGYTVYEVKAEGLFDWCAEKQAEVETFSGVYEEADAADWDCQECYCRNSGGWEEWLLMKENYIIEIETKETLTAAEKQQILQQLGIA